LQERCKIISYLFLAAYPFFRLINGIGRAASVSGPARIIGGKGLACNLEFRSFRDEGDFPLLVEITTAATKPTMTANA
jgi:hypothetical protein